MNPKKETIKYQLSDEAFEAVKKFRDWLSGKIRSPPKQYEKNIVNIVNEEKKCESEIALKP